MRSRSLFRIPSLTKRLAARTSAKRLVRDSLGRKAPRGWGWLTFRAGPAYNRIYDRTSIGCASVVMLCILLALSACQSEEEKQQDAALHLLVAHDLLRRADSLLDSPEAHAAMASPTGPAMQQIGLQRDSLLRAAAEEEAKARRKGVAESRSPCGRCKHALPIGKRCGCGT